MIEKITKNTDIITTDIENKHIRNVILKIKPYDNGNELNKLLK